MKSNKKKFEEAGEVTVQDILDWLDGRAISYTVTTRSRDCIGTCGKEQYHYGVFSKERFSAIHLSNKTRLHNDKSILDEYNAGKEYLWKTLSRNLIKKCKDKDSTIRIILRTLLPYFHFSIVYRSYDYINVKKILSKDGRSVYVHDKSKEISLLQSEIREMEERVGEARRKLLTLKRYQSIHEELHEDDEKIY